MYVVEGNKLVPLSSLPPQILMRGILYGDGVFESILYQNGKLHFLAEHYERLKKGLKVLDMKADLPTEGQLLKFLALLQKADETVRIRLITVREEGGLYAPEKNQALVLLSVEASQMFQIREVNAGVSTTVKLYRHPLSFAKTLNALPYILAGMEGKAKNWTTILIPNEKEIELVAGGTGNLIGYKPSTNTWILPGGQSGVSEGITRRMLITYLQENLPQAEIIDRPISHREILDYQIAVCNSFGFSLVKRIEGFDSDVQELKIQLLAVARFWRLMN